jgi:hypothetical protein
MAKFKQSNMELKDGQKLILDTTKAKYISYDGVETSINTTLSGVTPINVGHLTTKNYVDTEIDSDISTHTALSDAHHAESHTVASHSDTTATGAELETLTDNSFADTLHRHSELVASDGSPDPAITCDAFGNIMTVSPIEVGNLLNGTGNRYAYIDLIGDDTYTDFGLRIVRGNTGVNSVSEIKNRGTGTFTIITAEAGALNLGTANTTRIAMTGDGRTTFHGTILTTSLTYEGKVITVTVDDASAVFTSTLYCASDFHYERADADSAATMPCRALALESGAGSKKVLIEGQICHTGWNWTYGDMYVSIGTGSLTQTRPTGTGDQVQRIGWALSADTVYFRPDSTVVEIV